MLWHCWSITSHHRLCPPSPARYKTTALLNVFLKNQSVVSLEVALISSARLPNCALHCSSSQSPGSEPRAGPVHARGMQMGSGLTWSSHPQLCMLCQLPDHSRSDTALLRCSKGCSAAKPRGAGTLAGHSSHRQMGLDHSTAMSEAQSLLPP